MTTIYDFMTDEAQEVLGVIKEVHIQTSTECDILEDYDAVGVDLLQAEIPNAITFFDASLDEICEYLTDIGNMELTADMIRNDWYGGYIDVYYLTDLGGYLCIIGNR